MKQGRRMKKFLHQPIRYYDNILRELTRLDPDFAFERECCGERLIRERYSDKELQQRIGVIELMRLQPYLNVPLSNAGAQAIGLLAQQQAGQSWCGTTLDLNTQPGRIMAIEPYDFNPPYNPLATP